jgi:hypothetical protein
MSYSRRRGSGSNNKGAEHAAKHIQEAEEFSREVGGTDEDVKKYLFSLGGSQKEEILRLYGLKYSKSTNGDKPNAEAYARQTWGSWASGKRKMSGMVAKRLFALLPHHMPIAAKLNLVESLWRHSSPSSRETLRMDSRSQPQTVIAGVRKHFDDKLSHQIPENFTRRFDWLAGSDSEVKQQLLNHFRTLELNVAGDSLEPKIEVLVRHLQENRNAYISGSHTVSIGNHHLVLEFDNSEAIAELSRIEQARRKAEWAAKCDAFVEGAKKMALLAFGIVVLWLIIWKILKALS